MAGEGRRENKGNVKYRGYAINIFSFQVIATSKNEMDWWQLSDMTTNWEEVKTDHRFV